MYLISEQSSVYSILARSRCVIKTVKKGIKDRLKEEYRERRMEGRTDWLVLSEFESRGCVDVCRLAVTKAMACDSDPFSGDKTGLW